MCLVSLMLSLQMGMTTCCPYPLVYMNLLLLWRMFGQWFLQTLSVGSDCACPDDTIAESANCYVESEDCYITGVAVLF